MNYYSYNGVQFARLKMSRLIRMMQLQTMQVLVHCIQIEELNLI